MDVNGAQFPNADGKALRSRRSLVIRIKGDIIDALQPNAALTIRDMVEAQYAHLIQRRRGQNHDVGSNAQQNVLIDAESGESSTGRVVQRPLTKGVVSSALAVTRMLLVS